MAGRRRMRGGVDQDTDFNILSIVVASVLVIIGAGSLFFRRSQISDLKNQKFTESDAIEKVESSNAMLTNWFGWGFIVVGIVILLVSVTMIRGTSPVPQTGGAGEMELIITSVLIFFGAIASLVSIF